MFKEIFIRGVSTALGVIVAYFLLEMIKAYLKKKEIENMPQAVIDNKPFEPNKAQQRNDFISMYKSNIV